MPPGASIADRLNAVRRRLESAARHARRSPADICLIAVSKTFDADAVRAATDAGQLVFGENRVQEAQQKRAQLADLALDWHLIGHLQSNKARKAVAEFSWIDSVDNVELVRRLDDTATDIGRRLNVLIQVDLANEVTKHGAALSSVRAVVDASLSARSLTLRGLMVVPPYPDTPEESRPWFRRLRELRDELGQTGVPAEHLAELSMGMSHDFEVAIEEGSTMVRVGTAIFGTRQATVA